MSPARAAGRQRGAATPVGLLHRQPQVAGLCSQNGWPDPDTLRVTVERERPGELLCSVRFEELVVEGSGCCADRIECWGEFRLGLDAAGRITHAQRVAGPPA